MKLLFAHGWGFDRHIWDPLRALLPEWEHVADDRGYFGDLQAPEVSGPCLAVTHSFGTMRVLMQPPPGLVGIVAINGFSRFSSRPGKPGVPLRVIDRMIRRFETDPAGVLGEFRRQIGCELPFFEPVPAPLMADLLALRDALAPAPRVPILAISGGSDPLLPADLRAAIFPRSDLRRLDVPNGGHLLPLTEPFLCAQAIRGTLGLAGG